jgi:ribose-phosphate pyrophosphokinase
MKTININKQIGVKLKLYPDNQPHVQLVDINPGDEVSVVCSILDTQLLVNILQVASAIDYAGAIKGTLHIPYLMAARSDRVMEPGDSFDLEVVARMINSARFDRVVLYDVHSPKALILVHKSVNISNQRLVMKHTTPNSILICPDKGAAPKVAQIMAWNPSFTEVVYCDKDRDLSNGNITLKVLEPEKCAGRTCVIIDDLCDGGGTFLAIAGQIDPKHLTLIVTHGIFSKGLSLMKGVFDRIITSDSYRTACENPVEVVKLME